MNPPTIISHPEINGLKSIKLDYYQDERGLNFEICDREFYRQHLDMEFVLDSCSVSKYGVIRGMHGDSDNWKLIQCLEGKIQLFVVDYDNLSPTYMGVKEFILDSDKPEQILIPSKCLNGHAILSPKCVFYYKWSAGYIGINKQISLKWNDSSLNLPWLVKNPILSERDR